MYFDDPWDWKRNILSSVFFGTIFSTILLAIFILYMKDDPSFLGKKKEFKSILSIIPLIIPHVPWSAMRWSPRAKELKSEDKLSYDLLSFLIDFGFALNVFISLTFFFELFNYSVVFLILVMLILFYFIISIKILFFEFTPSQPS